MKMNGHARKSRKASAFVLRAERALRRAAQNVKTQKRALKLPLIVWPDGKLVDRIFRLGRACGGREEVS